MVLHRLIPACALGMTLSTSVIAQNYPAAPTVLKDGTAIQLLDFATVPATGVGATAQVARPNFMRFEPANAPLASSRFFVNDLNGKLYTVDQATKTFTQFIDFAATFNGAGGFDNSPGYAAGVVTVQFDPEYAVPGPNFGKFYTTHTELGANATEYRDAVLTAWQDTNISDGVFTGNRRQMMRVTYGDNLHPMGDIIFNPTAKVGDADYRKMYLSSGDGGAGERSSPADHNTPQALNNLLGKILRISPDDPDGAGSATYGIPTDNPFVSTAGARGEVWAHGFRNPHRMSWDATSNSLFVSDIGLHRWEEVNIVVKGGNYGYAEREGGAIFNSATGVDPAENLGYIYPVAEYSHRDGDAVSSGFVYRGTKMPQLVGKYVFGDITTGRLFYADLADLLAAQDGQPLTMADIHELTVFYNGVERRVFDIARDQFDLRNDGLDDNDALPGVAAVTGSPDNFNVAFGGLDPYGVAYGGGRADIRLAMDNAGELYLISKTDGMIRALVPEPASLTWLAVAAIALRRRR